MSGAIADNIKKLRSIFNVTQKELAEIAGVTENAVSKWENGYSEPRMGAVERMAACYGLSKSHIIEDGGMWLVDPLTRMPRRTPLNGAMQPVAEPRRAYAPLLGKVHAGDAEEPDVLEGRIPVPYEVLSRHRNGYFLKVEGGCMSRVYPEGCHVFVDPDREPGNGSVAVVSIDGVDFVMRRLYSTGRTLVLSPDSWEDGFEDIVIADPDEHVVEYAGTVVWFQPSKEME